MKNKCAFPIAVLAVAAVISASARTVMPLDEGWQFRWGKERNADEGWKTVDLPHDAQFEQPWQKGSGARGFKPMGEMWYRRKFHTPGEAAGNRAWLEFGGILCIADVYVNGTKVAGTDYGYLPVAADITGVLNDDGENTVEVWCSTGSTGGSRWYTGAGLYRDAKLVVKPAIAIARNGIFVMADASGLVKASVELDGFARKGGKMALDVVVTVRDCDGKAVAEAKATAPWSKLEHQEVALPEMTIENVKLWDVDSPNLYTAEVRLVLDGKEIDRDAVRFGARTVEFGYDFGMKLNGRKIFLTGMSCHHDLGCLGAAAYRRAIRRQFETMKRFGYNAIRCSHNPYSEDFYELADEMGLVVVDELIDKWSDKDYWLRRKPFTQIWPQLLTDWIKRDRNHPSIVAWSLGNEFQMREDLCGYQMFGDWGVTMFRIMREAAKRWDPTRHVTAAMYPARAGGITKNDPGWAGAPVVPEIAAISDFASFNYQWQTYGECVKLVPGLTIFQSEAAVRELAAPFFGMDREHTIGICWWGALEYWGESNKWPKKGWNYSFFSHALEPYPSAYLIKSAISKDPCLRIGVERTGGESEEWNDVKVGRVDESSSWEGKSGEMKRVRIYTNQREVELFLNGKSLGKKANDAKENAGRNIVTWQMPFEPGELKAVAGDVSHAIRTAGEAVALKAEVEADDYKADGKDLIYVRCRAVDKDGNQVCSWNEKVSFSCEGAAKFLACDNGDHYTDELFTSDITAKNAKDGFILGVFRCGKNPGLAKLSIVAEGLPPVELPVEIR